MRTSQPGRAITARSSHPAVTSTDYHEPNGQTPFIIAPPVPAMTLEAPSEEEPTGEREVVVLSMDPAGELDTPVDLQGRIEARAYEIYLTRNGEPGDALSDWLQAEAEIQRETDATDE